MVHDWINDKDLERKIEVDMKIPLSKLNLQIAKQLETLNPFGIGNPKPTFYSNVEIVDMRSFGKNNDHLKIFARDPEQKLFFIEFIQFASSLKQTSFTKGQIIDIAYQAEIDRWNGNEKLRGKIIHLKV